MFMPQIKPNISRMCRSWTREVDRNGFFFKLYVANNLNTMTAFGFPLYRR